MCTESFQAEDVFRSHLNAKHFHDVASTQVEEVMSACKRLLPCVVSTQFCPFCLTVSAQTQKGFASHVGKHQQEIALAALPNLEETDEDSSDDDDNSDDDNNNSDDNSDATSDVGSTKHESNDGHGESFDSDRSDRTIRTTSKKKEMSSSGELESQSSTQRGGYSQERPDDDRVPGSESAVVSIPNRLLSRKDLN